MLVSKAELLIRADCPVIQIKQNNISLRLSFWVRLLRPTGVTEVNYKCIRIIVPVSEGTEPAKPLIVDTIGKRS